MDELLNFENRKVLYQFLLDDYGFRVQEEKYYPDMFGNFSIDLVGDFFFLRYYNDRNILSIDISNRYDTDNWYALSFVKDLIYSPDAINANEEIKNNISRIEELNNFLKKDFSTICELFSEDNYSETRERLEEGLRKQFFLKHPQSKK